MSGGAQDLQDPAAEVECDPLVRPAVTEPEELAHRRALPGYERRAWTVSELAVAADVIAMPVGVRDDQFVSVPRVRPQPVADELVDYIAQREPGRIGDRAGVEQECPVAAEQQEHERGLVVDRLALPDDDGVRDVSHCLPPGSCRAGLCRAECCRAGLRRAAGSPP